MKNKNKQSGFTLIELLLTVALFSIFAGFSLPVIEQWLVFNDVDVAATTVAQSLRRAQTLAQNMDGDISWGVAVDSGDNNQIVLFRSSTQGGGYSTRDSSYDEVFDFPTSTIVSDISEVVFSRFTGTPTVAGTITLTPPAGSARVVTVNNEGAVSF